MRKNKSDFFVPGGKKFLNGDKPDQDTFEDLTDSTTFPTEITDRAKVSESGLTKTTTDLKVNTGDDTDQSGISPLGFPVIVKPSQLWRLSTSDPQVILTAVTRVPGSPLDSEDGSLIEDIEISLNVTPPVAAVTGADNGLTLFSNNIELGGVMYKATSVDASGFSFSLLNVDSFNSNGDFLTFTYTETITNEAQIVEIKGTSAIVIKTPACFALTATPGQVLTLTNASTGQCEWQSIPAGNTNIYLADGTLQGNRILNGDSFNLNFNNISTLSTSNVNSLDLTSLSSAQLVSANIVLSGTSTLLLATPGVNAATATLNQVLTLTNAATGECEWQTVATGTDTSLATDDQNLTGNRNVNGNTNTLSFNNLSSIGTGLSVTNITWSGAGITTVSGNTLRLTEGGMIGKSVGDMLVLKNASTGECEWEGNKYVLTTNDLQNPAGPWFLGLDIAFPTYDALTILGAVHGKGLNPIVQIYEDTSGIGTFTINRPPAVVEIKVDNQFTGDVTIAVPSGIFCKIIIM
jgi:hypothetical protein